MATFASAMPQIQTGNQLWDNNVNAGLAGIFGNPSQQAQAGYYGAETAKALIEARGLRNTQAYQKAFAKASGINLNEPGDTPAAPPPTLAGTVAPGPIPPPVVAPGPPGPGPVPPGAPGPGPVPAAAMPPVPPAASTLPVASAASAAPVANTLQTMPISQLAALSWLAGGHAPETSLLLRAELNRRITTGEFHGDTAAANREVSGLGDSAPLQAATTIQTTAMNNQATLALPGAQATATQRLEDAKPLVVIAPDGTRVPTTVGAWRQNPAMGRPENQYDQQPMSTIPKGAPGPGVTATGPAMQRGDTPYSPELVGSVDPGTGNTIWRRAMDAPGTRVGAVTTDQANAQGATKVTTLAEQRSPVTESVLDAYQKGQLAMVPRQNISPEQRALIKKQSDNYFANLYQPKSGYTTGGYLKEPAAPEPKLNAFHDDLELELESGYYRRDPAAAGPAAWEMMRQAKMLPEDIEDLRSHWTHWTGEYEGLTGPDSNQRVIVKGQMENAKNLVYPGGGPRIRPASGPPASLANTVAPIPTPTPTPTPSPTPTPTPAPTPPPVWEQRNGVWDYYETGSGTKTPTSSSAPAVNLGQSSGPAPPGVPDGEFIDPKTGVRWAIRGGQYYYLSGP